MKGKEGLALKNRTYRVYIGTYTTGTSKGIYLGNLNPYIAVLELSNTTKFTENPSYIAVHPSGRFLYSVNEVTEYKGKVGGQVSSFNIDEGDGSLSLINQRSSLGADPCYLSIDSSRKCVFVANYNGGNISVLPILSDGSLGEASQTIKHEGVGINPDRQEAPHPHCIISNEDNYVFVPDLGLDKIMIYRFDTRRSKLIATKGRYVNVQPGSGPRHLVFHPNGLYAYLINELANTVSVFCYDQTTGELDEVNTISSLPKSYIGSNTGADIHIHPSGQFLYVSNRGHNSIALFKIDDDGRKITAINHTSTLGKSPRGFCIDPSGTFLLVANKMSNTIVLFKINKDTGQLTAGPIVEVPNPTCIKIVV